MLDLKAIDLALRGTLFAGKMHHFPTIDSTNTFAMGVARNASADDDTLHGSCFVADEQTAGRGRSDHKWHSNAGEGLYLSVLLIPRFAADLVWLPLIAGLAAREAIQEVTALRVDLRWPNDLMIGKRKTGGILVEAHSEGGRVASAVIGIGINLHQHDFPPGLATEPTSLDLESGRKTSRQDLLIALLRSLDCELVSLFAGPDGTAIAQRVTAASSWIAGRQVEVHGPQACRGMTAGLDDRGFLRVRTSHGIVTVTTGGIRDCTDLP